MLVPHTEVLEGPRPVQGPVAFDGTPPIEAPQPMEGYCFALCVYLDYIFVYVACNYMDSNYILRMRKIAKFRLR